MLFYSYKIVQTIVLFMIFFYIKFTPTFFFDRVGMRANSRGTWSFRCHETSRSFHFAAKSSSKSEDGYFLKIFQDKTQLSRINLILFKASEKWKQNFKSIFICLFYIFKNRLLYFFFLHIHIRIKLMQFVW